MTADAVADALEEVALLLELKGENPFKTRAYTSAARTLRSQPGDLAELVRANRLGELPGIGDALQAKIAELVTTGALPYLDKLRAGFPPTLPELFSIPGLGPKKVKALFEHLQIDSLEKLEKACQTGAVAKLAGFGAKTQANILEGITRRRGFSGRFRRGDLAVLVAEILEILRACPASLEVAAAGSVRRAAETLKDLDFVVSSADPDAVMDAFASHPSVEKVTARGGTKCTVQFAGGPPADLRVVPGPAFASALAHFTGSKEHNVALRQRALARGIRLSEWGLFKAPKDGPEEPVPCPTESDLHRALGLHFIPPELRENLGEIEAAESGPLPRLVEWTDLRGAFHNHTRASDGTCGLEELAAAAAELGLEYLGVADHSKASFQANGLTEDRLLAQVAEIRAFNAGNPPCHLFAGSEVDILKDGSLDFPDDVLAELDYAVASVHSVFTLDEKAMTARIIRAVEHPRVTMLGHLTGRLLLRRDPYALNIPKIIDACAANGTWIELNANPWRLDMDWRWWRLARDKGVKCAINADAHHANDLHFLRIGAETARKGWLRREDVINTLPLAQIRAALA